MNITLLVYFKVKVTTAFEFEEAIIETK